MTYRSTDDIVERVLCWWRREVGGRVRSIVVKCFAVCVTLLAGAFALAGSGHAADLAGDCCADLEERISELEATAVRKGNRNVSLEVSGQVNEAVLYWDNGSETNTYQVTNMVSQSRFRFVGSARVNADLSAGYLLEIGIAGARSDAVDPTTDEGSSVSVRHSAWWLQSKSLGRVWLGQTSQATDGITEINIANTGHFASQNAAGQAGGLYLTLGNGAPTTSRLGVFMGGQNLGGTGTTDSAQIGEGNRRNLVKYESPTLAGFAVSASWGEDDFWDVALRYAGEFSGFKVALGIGYEQTTDGPGVPGIASLNSERNCAVPLVPAGGDVHCDQIGLSGAVMHVPTGLFAHAAYGIRRDEHSKRLWGADADDTSTQLYVQAGIEQNWLGIGKTTLFGEYQEWDIGATNKWFATDMTMWGIGINQSLPAAAMDLYVSYRNYGDLRAIDTFAGAWRRYDDVRTFMAGGIIRF